VARDRGVELRMEGLHKFPKIVADERRLFNAFYNLINNAITEVRRGGNVTILGEAAAAQRTISLAVADTGRGMSKDTSDSLLTSGAISRKPGGAGLGTKIVKDVINVHGSTIRVKKARSIEVRRFIFLYPFPSRRRG